MLTSSKWGGARNQSMGRTISSMWIRGKMGSFPFGRSGPKKCRKPGRSGTTFALQYCLTISASSELKRIPARQMSTRRFKSKGNDVRIFRNSAAAVGPVKSHGISVYKTSLLRWMEHPRSFLRKSRTTVSSSRLNSWILINMFIYKWCIQ